ncbi:MAG: ATPase [Cyanobacteria bacterium Co-bin13]|nr:ATPase [Cyanobacteria bacterium Co-bin13]
MTVSRTICLGFLIMVVLGTLLLFLPLATHDGQWNDPLIALFTATSAVCVTGLIVVDTGTYFSPQGQGIILGLIQLGGLGYMTATTLLLLLLGRRLGLRDRLAVQQSLDTAELAGSRTLVVSIIAMTLVFELTGAFLLMPTMIHDYGMSYGVWLALFHSISAFNNAGFSLFEDSLIQYATSAWVNFVIIALVIFGGIGYQVIMEGFMWMRDRIQGKRERIVFSLHFKVVTSTSITLVILGTLAILAIEYYNPATLAAANPDDRLLMALFQSVITRTAGFNSIDIGAMEGASLFIVIGLMFIGASPASTGGGIKTTTLRLLFTCTRMVLRGKEEVILYQRQIPSSRLLKAVAVIFGSLMVVMTVTTLLSLFDPEFRFIQLLFETVSAFATVGLSTGITADLTPISKLLIIVTMYVGRVGVLLLIASLLGDPQPSVIHYPEEDVLIG